MLRLSRSPARKRLVQLLLRFRPTLVFQSGFSSALFPPLIQTNLYTEPVSLLLAESAGRLDAVENIIVNFDSFSI